MTSPRPRWVDPNPPEPVKSRAPVLLAVTGAVLGVAVIVVLVAVTLLGNKDAGSDHPAGEAVLVAIDGSAGDPFTQSIQVGPVLISDAAKEKAQALLRQIPISAPRKVQVAPGLTDGLYGTTGNAGGPCDIVALANILDAKPAVAQPWGKALGLTPQEIPFYLNTLTPVVLLGDFWVTTHSPHDGALEAHQAILQAGSAVLVDQLGVPRVRCASGSPLTPPANSSIEDYRLTGDEWAGFSSENIIAIAYSTAGSGGGADQLNLVEVTSGQQVTQKAGQSIDLGTASISLPDPAAMNIPSGRG